MQLKAQTSADWWYFGRKAGIHFTSSGPVADTNSVMKVIEGCASAADEFGNLLFYTSGDTVWDANHNVMQNGTGLLGNGIAGSGAQSAYIVPRPNSATEFYLFTIRSYFGGMHYSKIDMTLNGGLGGVVVGEKNVPLVGPTPEIMTSARKPNNLDYWMITLKTGTDTAYAYEITSAGINLNPVKSSTGVFVDTSERVGYMRISQQSDRFAVVFQNLYSGQTLYDKINIYSFNNATGQIAYDFGISPSTAINNNYGIEFSPDGSRIYCQSVTQADLRQYNLNAGSLAAINASEELVGVGYSANGGGALQLGPDGVIYAARNADQWLAAVLFPNALGTACGYNHDGVSLDTRFSIWGLPQFPPFFIQGEVSLNPGCVGDTNFFNSSYINVDSIRWNFGDPASGSANTSILNNPTHVYSDSGTYVVTVIAFNGFLSDTNVMEIKIFPRQVLDLGPDTIICLGQEIAIDLNQPYASFLWSSGDTSSAITLNTDTSISVTVFGVCDTLTDGVSVTVLSPFFPQLGPDTLICDGVSLSIGTEVPADFAVTWNEGSTNDTIAVTQTGSYILSASNLCFSESDTIEVTFLLTPSAALPADTVNCFDQAIVLSHASQPNVTYLWSNGSSSKNYKVDTTELVWLTAANLCDTASDTVSIVFNGEIKVDLGADTNICSEDSILLVSTWKESTYLWNTGDTVDSIWTDAESKKYVVTITDGSCFTIVSKQVEVNELFCPEINCELKYGNVLTPNGDGINDVFRVWSDCEIYSFSMNIYNRWGQLMFTSNNASIGWDGYSNGEIAANGVYYFEIDFKDLVVVDEDNRVYRGNLTLSR